MLQQVTFSSAALIGFFLGFGFGVGCALAVMYSVFLGGYQAALRDSLQTHAPERLRRMQKKLSGSAGT